MPARSIGATGAASAAQGAVALPRQALPRHEAGPDSHPSGSFALDAKHLLRSVNSLAFPIIGEDLFQTMLGMVDLIMVGKLGAVAIVGVGTALQIMFIVLAALAAVDIGTTVLVARAIGADQPDEAARAIKQSLVLGVVLAAIIKRRL